MSRENKDTMMCPETRVEKRLETVRMMQPECSYALPSFDYGDIQESLQNASKESVIQQQHEESIDYNDEENIETVQHKLQMKSKVAMENIVKSKITSDLLKHKIEEERRIHASLDERIKILKEEQEDLNNKEFIQNARLMQFRRELENIREIVDVFNKHNTNDNSQQKAFETEIAKHRLVVEKFKADVSLIKQKFETINGNIEKIRNLEIIKQNLSDDYKAKVRHLEKQIAEIIGFTRENDVVLEDKQKINESLKLENARLEDAIQTELKNEERYKEELIQARKLADELKVEKNKKQEMMNIELEENVNEINRLENELKSRCEKESFLQQELSELQVKNATTSHDIECLKVSLVENENIMETEIAKLTMMKRDIEEINQNHVEFMKKIENEIESISAQYVANQSETQNIAQESENIKISIEKLNHQLTNCKQQLATAETDITSINSTNTALIQARDNLLQKNQSLQQTLNEITSNHTNLMEFYNNQKLHTESNLLELRSKLDKLDQELASKTETYTAQIDELKQSHSIEMHLTKGEYQFKLDELKEEHEKLNQSFENMKADRSTLQSDLEKKTQYRDGLYEKYKKLQAEIEALKGLAAGGSTSSLNVENTPSWSGLGADKARPASQPVGILKPTGNDFVVPPAPKSVTFRNTISWNSTSNSTSLESLFDEVAKMESKHKKPSSIVSVSAHSQADSISSMLNDMFNNENDGFGPNIHPCSYTSSPPTRLSDTNKENNQN